MRDNIGDPESPHLSYREHVNTIVGAKPNPIK
jgi:hypothetical protein